MKFTLKNFLRYYWFSLLILIAIFGVSFYLYPMLPAKIPTHWNLYGEVDGWSSKGFGVWFLPFFTLGLFLLFIVIPFIDPRRENYEKFFEVYVLFINGFLIFMGAMHVATLLVGLGYQLPIGKLVPIGIGLLFILIGFTFGRVKSNYFFGIRTPWTLESSTVWEKTHKASGKFFIASGIIMALAAFLPPMVELLMFILLPLFTTVAVMVYSYRLYEQEKKNNK